MPTLTYEARRGELLAYFDRTAARAWERLTSDAPVSGIRATVRAGRDAMRGTLLSWLPADMTGLRLLDAGCGTGALAIEAARRGADVLAVDISPTLIGLAHDRAAGLELRGRVDFQVGDMLDHGFGGFDHVVAMDSLIHYQPEDVAGALAGLAARTLRSIVFTFPPKTPLLAAMHGVGRFFPRGDRAPAIVPVGEGKLRRLLAAEPGLKEWRPGHGRRVSRGFYTSHALELRRP